MKSGLLPFLQTFPEISSLERLVSASRTSNSKRGQRSSIEIDQLSSRHTIAGFQSDEPKGEDLLGITKEVNALCSIIAANDVQPPLSIGLFGDWGNGKSFFMRRMHARIEKIKTVAQNARGQSAYCEHIVQMKGIQRLALR